LGGFDEQMYRIFAIALGTDGPAAIRYIVQQFPDNETLRQGPLPLRIAYIAACTLAGKLLGGYSFFNLALVSLISGIGVIILGYFLLREWFGPSVVFLSCLLLVTSPLAAGLSRRALSDSFFTFLAAGIFLFYDRSWRYKRMRDALCLGVFLTTAFLAKESVLLLYPCLGLAAFYYRKEMHCVMPLRIAVPLFLSPLIYLLVSAWIAGGLQAYLHTYITYSQMPRSIAYSLKFQKGPWFRYLIDFFLISPGVYIFSLAGMCSFVRLQDSFGRRLAVVYSLGGLVLFSMLIFFNLRLVLFVDIFLRALAALGILSLAGRFKNINYRYAALAVLLILVLATDIHQFFKLFIRAGVYDPVTAFLIDANGFVR